MTIYSPDILLFLFGTSLCGIVNKEEIDVFPGLYSFFDDPADVGTLISGSSAFSKSQLEHLEVHGSCIAEAWLGEFRALLY